MSLPAVDEQTLAGEILDRLRSGRSVRRAIPGGRIDIDRPMPFLAVVRRLPQRTAIEDLVHGQASYLVASDEPPPEEFHSTLRTLVEELSSTFGAVLLVEVWPGDVGIDSGSTVTFRIHTTDDDERSTTVSVLSDALRKLEMVGHPPTAEVVVTGSIPSPPGLPPLIPAQTARKAACVVLGLEVPPTFVDAETGERFPLLFRDLQRELSAALKRTFFEFANVQTSFEADDYRALGRREVLDAARDVDRKLVDLAEELDFLLAVTPVNTEEAWLGFEGSGYGREPDFHYRPLRVDPDILKRRLFDIEIEQVDDPTLAALFRSKRREVDRLVSMLEDRGSGDFLPGSIQLYGAAENELHDLATQILGYVVEREEPMTPSLVGAETFKLRVDEELASYRHIYPALRCDVQVRDDFPGVLVSDGDLVIGAGMTVGSERVEALVQHEVGTHVVTHTNGSAQPLLQLQVGLPGYEQTQEGLAVLAEYMVGGLSRSRIATLAARVIAVRSLVDGATFVETFRLLHSTWGLGPRSAFTTSMRVHRSGGLTKDAIYLRGLDELVAYVATGAELDPLFVGKIALEDVPMIEELRWRGVLQPPVVRPRWLDRPESRARLARLRSAASVLDLALEVTG